MSAFSDTGLPHFEEREPGRPTAEQLEGAGLPTTPVRGR
jgi:hypothetical protein